MKITCISASNTKLMGKNSTSIKVCNLIKDIIIKELGFNAVVNTLPLVDYDLKTCILCGKCSELGKCIYDDDFNKVLLQLEESDAAFFVVPYYSPIPSKLLMILEKINEIAYASWINNPDVALLFTSKTIGIIGHGGMAESEETLNHYYNSLITPIANTLKSLSFHVVGLDETYPNGVPFGLKDDNCLRKVEKSIFPEVVQDYTLIESRIKPLVVNVMNKITGL